MSADTYRLDGGLKGWILKTARGNFWRVAAWYDLDDLIQDGYLCYYECCRVYRERGPTPGDDRRRFITYFFRAYTNRICDLSKAHSRAAARSFGELGLEERDVPPLAQPEEASCAAALACAPAEVQVLLDCLTNDSGVYLRSRLSRRTTAGGNARIKVRRKPMRETQDERLKRVTGRGDTRSFLRQFFLAIET